jgi:RNA polymerase sigma-B factor
LNLLAPRLNLGERRWTSPVGLGGDGQSEEAIADLSGNGRPSNGGASGGRGNDLADREGWVLELLPLARRLARRYAGGPEQLDDLEQVAFVGVVKAVSRFDPKRGTPLTQFAVPFIHGELKHHLRDNLGLPRVPRAAQSKAIKVAQTARALELGPDRMAATEEIADRTGLTRDEVLASLELAAAQRTRSLNATPGTESAAPPDALAQDDEGLDLVEYRHSLARILRSLEGRERSLLFLRLGAGRSHKEAAESMGMSPGQAARLFRQALAKARAIAAAVDQPPEDAPGTETGPSQEGPPPDLSPGFT